MRRRAHTVQHSLYYCSGPTDCFAAAEYRVDVLARVLRGCMKGRYGSTSQHGHVELALHNARRECTAAVLTILDYCVAEQRAAVV